MFHWIGGWGNASLIGGIIGALVVAGVALYRARPQRNLDAATTRKIEVEIARETATLDSRRALRVLRLEKYVDDDIEYHRRNNAYQHGLIDYQNELTTYQHRLNNILERAIRDGRLPWDRVLPVPPKPPLLEPPEPPQLPRLPDDPDSDITDVSEIRSR